MSTRLPGNEVQLDEEKRMLAIESATDDPASAHRRIRLYNTLNCTVLDEQALPAGASEDQDYFIADITFNKLSHLVGIRGKYRVFVYDMLAAKLLPELEPRYPESVMEESRQAGTVEKLEVWEDYLLGFEAVRGAFAFDLSTPSEPRPMLPLASFQSPEEGWRSLFLLPSGPEYQAMVPFYDPATQRLDLNLVFSEPQPIFLNQSRPSPDGRFVVLRVSDVAQARAVVVDLEGGKRIALPDVYARGNDDQLFEYLRSRR